VQIANTFNQLVADNPTQINQQLNAIIQEGDQW